MKNAGFSDEEEMNGKENIVNRKHTFLEVFNCAIEGIVTAIKLERNMKIHVFMTICVGVAALFFRLNTMSFAILTFTISMVWVAELLNSAVEKVVDLVVGTNYHPMAKKAKDIAAGAVLVAAINSVIIAYLVFLDHTKSSSRKFFDIIRSSNSHIGIIALVLVAVLVVSIKAIFAKGTPLQGGMPSGHGALASSAATLILLSTHNTGVIILTIFIAALVAQSRVKTGVHTFAEVSVGLILGFLVTFFLMTAFKG